MNETIIDAMHTYTLSGDFILSDLSRARRFLDAQSLVLDREVRKGVVGVVKKWWSEGESIVALSSSPASIILATFFAEETRAPLYLLDKRLDPPVPDMIEELSLKGPQPSEPFRALVIADVTVSGRTAVEACRQLTEYGLDPAVATILDRDRGARDRIMAEGFQFHYLFQEDELWPDENLEAHKPLNATMIRNQRERIVGAYPMRKAGAL